jgi:lipopolysaccharide transport system permease protein
MNVSRGRSSPDRSWDHSLRNQLGDLFQHRELLYLMTLREVRVRYKQTTLGVLWAVLQPLALMGVFTVFFSLFVGIPTDGQPYPIFSYAGLLPWTFFATALATAVPSLIANSYLITRTAFPREIVPLASVLAALVDFGVAALLLGGLLALYRVPITWNILWIAPVTMLLLAFTVGVCLLLSAFVVIYRDVRFTLPLLTQLWMFVTPILYPVTVVPPQLRTLYLSLNPLAALVDSFRRAVLDGQPPAALSLANATIATLLMLAIGYTSFKRLERRFADII